ncbi:MAG: tetratricopeptide repeat protein [Candidatus Eisenbacteria bacterium]|jgi:tetratricopeptide (TPR) repeat protein|nr:tetratricopeptide repeat protein [Candidatus Eisenbacteria bacterium]
MRRALIAGIGALLAVGCASVEGQYRKAVESRNENRIRSFIHGHPESPLVMDAVVVLDTVRFERAAADTGTTSLQHFMQTYPTSRLAANASILLAERVRTRDIARLTAQVQSDPTAAALVALADLHRSGGGYVAADSLYRRATELEPDNASAHTGLALAYLERGMTTEADQEIEHAQRLAPSDGAVLLAAGEYYRLVGRPDLAISSFQKVLNGTPDNPQAHLKLGLLYLDIGRNRNAVWEFLRVRELDSKNISALYYLAVAYADQGDGVTALRYLETYMGAPHSAEDAEILAKAQVLYDRLKGEVRKGEGMEGGVVADPNNPTQGAQPAAQGRNPSREPSSSHGKAPVGSGIPGPFGGRGGVSRKGG